MFICVISLVDSSRLCNCLVSPVIWTFCCTGNKALWKFTSGFIGPQIFNIHRRLSMTPEPQLSLVPPCKISLGGPGEYSSNFLPLNILLCHYYRHGMCFRASSVFVLSILFWFPQRTHYFWRVFRFPFMEHKQDYSATSVKDVKVCF